MFLVVGLGNPGPRYENTRHNVGAWVLDQLWEHLGAGSQRAHGCLMGSATYRGQEILLLRPGTYMNRSGHAVARFLEARLPGADPGRILVIHDDLDLPVGRGRVKLGGGAGGHRGVRSVMECLGTDAFGRIRVGIGRPPGSTEAADFVLSPFEQEEEETVAASVLTAMKACLHVIDLGYESAMSAFNGRDWDDQ